MPPPGPNPLDTIVDIAARSPLARFNWKDRGVAPRGYIKGMALVYARVHCKLKAGHAAAIEMAKADTGDQLRDALAWYAEQFHEVGMNNDVVGDDTLRHLFVLLIGLGMRESSGRYCEGRDRSASNTTAETAEAGLFQTSFNAKSASPVLPLLFDTIRRIRSGFSTSSRRVCMANSEFLCISCACRDLARIARCVISPSFLCIWLRQSPGSPVLAAPVPSWPNRCSSSTSC
jgi:hypothetical protein